MKYALWLFYSGLTNHKIGLVLNACHGAKEVYETPERQLAKIYGFREEDVNRLVRAKREKDPDRLWLELAEKGISFVSMEQPAYPTRLRRIHNPPYGLFYLGHLPSEEQRLVAIVGARECSSYGSQMAFQLAEELSRRNVGIVSGLARGIDGEGHRGCLKGGAPTYGILAGGVDICYPGQNRYLYDQIPEKGGIFSEYAPGSPHRANQFPARNRIISGLADCVVVIEARKKSGSLITADYALEQGKEVYALPGRVTDSLSGGCNELIRQGAGIFTGINDFLSDLDLFCGNFADSGSFIKNILEKDELLVYSLLDFCPMGIGTMLEQVPMALTELLEVLERLEQKGVIREEVPNFFVRSL